MRAGIACRRHMLQSNMAFDRLAMGNVGQQADEPMIQDTGNMSFTAQSKIIAGQEQRGQAPPDRSAEVGEE